ncbi:MAG: hypothetical protein CMN32_01245 [Saprospirales bacterium]|nr:hypothetical protein [Saprospirales bacterium]
MTDFFDYFKGWFRKAETSTPSNPALHEVIERDASYKAEFEAWKESLACRRIMDWLWHQYAMWVSLPNEVEKSIDFLDTPSSKGFAIHYSEEQVPARECRFLLDFLREKVLELPYRQTLADRRIYMAQKEVETLERYYLKPRQIRSGENRINQRFGNITIELVLRNDKPHQLRFRATSYNDRLYAEADAFKELFQGLCS